MSKVQLWAQDEARFGRQPIISRRWAKVGHRALVEVNPQYEWMWSYGAVNPHTGESFFLLLPNLQAESVEIFSREFARGAESVEGKHNRDDVGRRTGASWTFGSAGGN